MRSLYAVNRRVVTAGRNPNAVRAVDSLISAPCAAHSFHLSTTLVAHQKLATLSSNKPLAKGNMRVIGCMIAENGASGGKNGRKRITIVATVVTARRTKSWVLEGCQLS